MSDVLSIGPLGFLWATIDPFLFCVHHLDAYPAGDERMGPSASLEGRRIGMDFEGKDGWRMYHGDIVPGFPQHPHRGFETVSIVRRGLMDHADSLGATARFGDGDVQWMTAGKGIVHSEMFPLIDRSGPNPLEMFQVWLNLPAADKMVEPHFTMLWADTIRSHTMTDDDGRSTEIRVVAGSLANTTAPEPPPSSWAARPDSDVAIWTMVLEPHAICTLPAARPETNRTLYFFEGESVTLGARQLSSHCVARVRADVELTIANGPQTAELLLLQGKPIGESVVQHGPFVMNTAEEIAVAFRDYRRTQFGGWPWPSDGPVHPRSEGRFARHTDGRVERK